MLLSAYQLFVDPSKGNDPDGTGTSALPFRTISHALASILAPGDTVDVRVIGAAPVLSSSDSLALEPSQLDGSQITIEPDIAGATMTLSFASQKNFCVINSGFTSPTGVTIKNLSVGGLLHYGFISPGEVPNVSLTLNNCSFTHGGAAATSFVQWGNSNPNNNQPNITIDHSTVINFAGQLVLNVAGDVVVDNGSVFRTSVDLTSDLVYANAFKSVLLSDSQFVPTGGGNYGILEAVPLGPTSITLDGFTFDGTNFRGSPQALVNIPQFNPATPAATKCTISIRNSHLTFIGKGTTVLVSLGLFDDGTKTREQTRAALTDRNGGVVIEGNTLINTGNVGGSGALALGEGADNAVVMGNFIRNGDATVPSGHCLDLSGDGILFEDNVCVGFLTCTAFGNNETIKNNTMYCFASGIIFGKTGGGAWNDSQGSICTNNIIEAIGPSATNQAAISDYHWNARYNNTDSKFANQVDGNLIWCPNGEALANYDAQAATSVTQMQNIWKAGSASGLGTTPWGLFPNNDAGTSSVDPMFANPSALDGFGGFAPKNPAVAHSDGTFFGAVGGAVAGRVSNPQTGVPVVGATIYIDANKNGQLDSGETSTMTDGSGNYLIQSLPAGTFRVTEIPTAGLSVGAPAAGYVDEAVAFGTQLSGVNFGDTPIPAVTGPDLVASLSGTLPKSALSGDSGKVLLRITNRGKMIATGSTFIPIYASADQSLDSSDLQITQYSTRFNLRPGQSQSISILFKYPAGFSGPMHVIASVNPADVIAETSYANDVAATSKAVMVAAPFVDLAGSYGQLRTMRRSSPGTVPIKIDNLGNVPAVGSIPVDMYLSSDTTLDSADTLIAHIDSLPINIKPRKAKILSLPVRGTLPPAGHYYLILQLNVPQGVSERNIANNTVVSGSTISLT